MIAVEHKIGTLCHQLLNNLSFKLPQNEYLSGELKRGGASCAGLRNGHSDSILLYCDIIMLYLWFEQRTMRNMRFKKQARLFPPDRSDSCVTELYSPIVNMMVGVVLALTICFFQPAVALEGNKRIENRKTTNQDVQLSPSPQQDSFATLPLSVPSHDTSIQPHPSPAAPSNSDQPKEVQEREHGSTVDESKSGDMTLIWLAVTVWILCFCCYAMMGEDNSISDRRALGAGRAASVTRATSATTPASAQGEVTRNNQARTRSSATTGSNQMHSRLSEDLPYSDCIRRGHAGERVVDESIDSAAPDEEKAELECCSICLEQFEFCTSVKQLSCGHIFHPSCITIWLDVSSRCPLCRHDLNPGANGRAQRARRIELSDNFEMIVRENITTLYFSATLNPEIRFGVTIAATGNGLLVTYVEQNGSGSNQGVEVGDYLVKQDGEPVPRTIGDAEFVAALIALARPVELGFARQIEERDEEEPAIP